MTRLTKIITISTLLLSMYVLPPSLVYSNATMQDFWEGRAEWKLRNRLTLDNTGWEYGYGGGSHIHVVNGIWYHFGQKVQWGSYCGGNKTQHLKQGISVRISHDKGITWTQAGEIVTPTNGTEWDCMATDGDIFYEPATNTWHHLFQCLKGVGDWNTCYQRRIGNSPIGTYQSPHTNPVIVSGDLWYQICDQPVDICSQIAGGPQRVKEEGTPNIFYKDNNHFFVGFHGFYDPYGFRGIAKTTNFSRFSWIAGDSSQGVPNDSVFDKNKANVWREQWQGENIGGGAARIFKEGSYFYQIIEAADLNLGCVDGQNWNHGLYRTTNLTSTNWAAYPRGNPIIYSSKWPEPARDYKSSACNPAYIGIFKDDHSGKIYMHTTQVQEQPYMNGVFIYELKPTKNLLHNSNLWKCNLENWSRIMGSTQTTNYSAYRHFHLSSDATCFMATNCGGTSCQAGQSIYQDINVANRPSHTVSFGGKFSNWPGQGNSSNNLLAIHEHDSAGNHLQAHSLNLNINESYSHHQKTITLNPNTNWIRYQIYLNSPKTLRVDETFVSYGVYPFFPYLNLISNFNKSSAPIGDLNQDNKVNLFDLNVWLKHQ